jgi:signal transduction histidine kinase
MEPAELPTDEQQAERISDAQEIAILAGKLAHEIKNPLSTIRMNMELLAEDFEGSVSPRDRRALQKIRLVEAESTRLQHILDDFLKYTKARRMDFQPTNLNAEIERLLEVYAPKAADARIEIIKYLDPDLPSVQLDHQAMQSVLWNLILNAEQAMPEGGQLVVRTHAIPAAVVLDLIDTGIGMDEKTITRIFEAFYSTKPAGSGLGLPTAKKIVEAHGGAMDVQSEPGHGTKFSIILPIMRRLPGEEDLGEPIPLPAVR